MNDVVKILQFKKFTGWLWGCGGWGEVLKPFYVR